MFYRDLDGRVDINFVLFSGNANPGPGHVKVVGKVASLGQRDEKCSFH